MERRRYITKVLMLLAVISVVSGCGHYGGTEAYDPDPELIAPCPVAREELTNPPYVSFEPGGLTVEPIRGSLEIIGTPPTGRCSIFGNIRVCAEDKETADKLLEETEVEMDKTEAGITIEIDQPRTDFKSSIRIDLTVSVPADTDITLQDVQGSIRIENISGAVNIPKEAPGDHDLRVIQ